MAWNSRFRIWIISTTRSQTWSLSNSLQFFVRQRWGHHKLICFWRRLSPRPWSLPSKSWMDSTVLLTQKKVEYSLKLVELVCLPWSSKGSYQGFSTQLNLFQVALKHMCSKAFDLDSFPIRDYAPVWIKEDRGLLWWPKQWLKNWRF